MQPWYFFHEFTSNTSVKGHVFTKFKNECIQIVKKSINIGLYINYFCVKLQSEEI
jgi:hypothetical protein